MRLDDYLSAEEARKLASAFVLAALGLSLFALFDFMVVPALRRAGRPPADRDVPQRFATGWLDPTDFPPARGYALPAVDPASLMAPSPALLARAGTLYPRLCAACHGPLGRGDGPAAATMLPPPRDFSSAEGWKRGPGLAGVFETVTKGVPGGSMAGFDHLPAADRVSLAHLVRSFPAVPLGQDDPKALAGLAAALARAGGAVPNRIPVAMAMEKLAAEYSAPEPLAPGPFTDPAAAAAWLSASGAWRKGPAALAAAACGQAPANGFAVSAAALDMAGWRELYSRLIAVYGDGTPRSPGGRRR